MQYIAMIKVVLSLLPAIIEAVKAIEAAFPASGQGPYKLEMVRAIIQAAYDAGSGAVAQFDEVWPAIKPAIDNVVGFMNLTGVLKK